MSEISLRVTSQSLVSYIASDTKVIFHLSFQTCQGKKKWHLAISIVFRGDLLILNSFSRTKIKAGPKTVVCQEADLRGEITIGNGRFYLSRLNRLHHALRN